MNLTLNIDKNGKVQPLHQFVRKVVFTLHESFPNNVIEIEKPPFAIVRNGWGEFDVNITIYFQDMNEEPVTKIHGIKIFHQHQHQRATIKKPVVNESYDEIVFNEPTEFFYHMLTDDPEETFKSQFINPFPNQDMKKEENKSSEGVQPSEEKLKEENTVKEEGKDKEMEVEKPEVDAKPSVDGEIKSNSEGAVEGDKNKDADVEMKPEEDKTVKKEGENEEKIVTSKEEKKEDNDDIVANSTYEV